MEETKLHDTPHRCQVSSVLTTDPRIRAAYAEGAGIYRIVPSAVAIPSDVADVVELIHHAKGSRTALIPRGAGSGMPGGNVGSGIIVDLSTGEGFSELAVDPHTQIARAGTSVTCAEVNAAARAYGLRIPRPAPSRRPVEWSRRTRPDPARCGTAACGIGWRRSKSWERMASHGR